MPHINKHIRKCLREPANPETFQSLSVTGKIPPQAHIRVWQCTSLWQHATPFRLLRDLVHLAPDESLPTAVSCNTRVLTCPWFDKSA